MKLTSDYKRVTALFNNPSLVEEDPRWWVERKPSVVRLSFNVGPFFYLITFKPYLDDPSEVRVDFILYNVKIEGKTLAEVISQLVKRPVSSHEAERIRSEMIDKGAGEKVGIGMEYSAKVFGTVCNAVKDYIDKYHPKCMIIKGETDRKSLYKRLIQRAFPQAILETLPLETLSSGKEIMGFRVCLEQ
jgi:hypothetical protein